jgi:hypothetical protein
MWRGLKRNPVPSGRPSPGGDHRVATAKYNLADRRDIRTGLRLFIACRVETIDCNAVALSAPVAGEVGEAVLIQVDLLGEVRGFVTKRTRTGFVMSITATDSDRAKLKLRIDWFEKIRGRKVVNKRRHDRFTPSDQLSTLILADGSTIRCLVVDMSSSGAAVSAKVMPPPGTPLALGKIVGRVVRHLPNGFAIQFINPVEIDTLETLLIKPSI